MNTKIAFLVFAFVVFLSAHVADAQTGKLPRIGYISLRSGIEPREEQFQRGLRELGYNEGQNILIEWRFAANKEDRLPEFAAEMVRLEVDVIVAAGTQAIRAAKQETTTIPIVIGQVGDPVQLGFVASLAKPGGNITGTTTTPVDLPGKRLEMLKEAIPGISRVAFLQDSRNPGNTITLRETEAAARTLGVQLQNLDVQRPDDLDNAFQTALNWGAQAVIESATGIFASNQDRDRIAKIEVKTRLPVMHSDPALVLAGGLMSYSTDVPEQFRRAATYVDKILKGAKPADMPVEQPTKYELVVNLKTAEQIGMKIPQSVLNRADKVIK